VLTWTTLTTDTAAEWAELTNLLAKVDDTDEFYEAEDLAEELEEHGFDPKLDSWAVWDGATMVAYGQLRVSHQLTSDGDARADLGGGVHPDWRGRGIGTELLARMEPRAVALASERHPEAPVQLRTQGGKEGSDARPLLTDNGYAPARYFTDMTRPLPGDQLPSVDDPRIQPFTSELTDATRLAHNDAFATHWGSTAQTAEGWADMVGSRSFRADVSRVLVEDGVVLAYALCGQWVDRELYITLIGTRQQARGQGLARRVLTATLAAAAASGSYDVADLGVDSANPTGAGALYASVGFTPVRTQATLAKRP
jgi:mycothiol synthase